MKDNFDFIFEYTVHRERQRKSYQGKKQLPIHIHEGSFLHTFDNNLQDNINSFVDDYVPNKPKTKYKDTYGLNSVEVEFNKWMKKERKRQREAQQNGASIALEREKFWHKLLYVPPHKPIK